MTTEHKLILVFLALFAVGGSLGTYLVMSERAATREAQLKAEAAQKSADDAKADMAKRDAEAAAALKAFQTQLSQIKTNQDVATTLARPSSKLPALAFNPFEVEPSPTPGDPNAVSVNVPQKNIVPLFKSLETCAEQHDELGHCLADVADTEKERDAALAQAKIWEKAAKPGVASRSWFATRVAGCGGLGAAAGVATGRKNAPIWGSIAGVGFCALALRW
jgi:hypothetical protein